MPTWDLFLALFFVIGISYGFVLQRDRVIITLLGTYLAYLVTQTASPLISQFFNGDRTLLGELFIKVKASPFSVHMGVFLVSLMLISLKGGLDARRGKGLLTPLEIIVFSALNMALILDIVLTFMPAVMRQSMIDQSRIVTVITAHHAMWIVLPIALMVLLGFMRKGVERRFDSD